MNKWYFSFCLLVFLLAYCTSKKHNRSRCKCFQNVAIKCHENATNLDLYQACNQHCGQLVNVLYVHSPSSCMKNTLEQKCKQITTVYIDDSDLCDCYCNVTTPGFTVKPANIKFPIDCHCFKPDSSTTQVIPITTAAPPKPSGIFVPGFVLITIGILTVLALVIGSLMAAGFVYKEKLGEYYEKFRSARSTENQGLVFNEN